MSIKHRVKDRASDGKMRALWRIGAGEFSRVYVKWGYMDCTKSPSWYNRMYNNQPKRTEARALCRDIVKGRREADAVIFPHAVKPNLYYW